MTIKGMTTQTRNYLKSCDDVIKIIIGRGRENKECAPPFSRFFWRKFDGNLYSIILCLRGNLSDHI